MGYFICENCGTLEKTDGGGSYWNVKARLNLFDNGDYNINPNKILLCRFCIPKTFEGGEIYQGAIDEFKNRPDRVFAMVENKQKILNRYDPENFEIYFKKIENKTKV